MSNSTRRHSVVSYTCSINYSLWCHDMCPARRHDKTSRQKFSIPKTRPQQGSDDFMTFSSSISRLCNRKWRKLSAGNSNTTFQSNIFEIWSTSRTTALRHSTPILRSFLKKSVLIKSRDSIFYYIRSKNGLFPLFVSKLVYTSRQMWTTSGSIYHFT